MTRPAAVLAVLFDRDDTLVVDVPYNGAPERVELMPGAREAVRRLREHGLPVGVVSNQSGIGRGLLTEAGVRRVNARIEDLLGPIDVWVHCPHVAEDGCACRKPAPGLVLQAARRLGVRPEECVLIGDIGADMGAARAAGARGVLVPTTRTLPEEVAAAPKVCPDLLGAVRHVLDAARAQEPPWAGPEPPDAPRPGGSGAHRAPTRPGKTAARRKPCTPTARTGAGADAGPGAPAPRPPAPSGPRTTEGTEGAAAGTADREAPS
jgi:HAD superfamily hydrolase (TIGR01662 family)